MPTCLVCSACLSNDLVSIHTKQYEYYYEHLHNRRNAVAGVFNPFVYPFCTTDANNVLSVMIIGKCGLTFK